MDGVLWCFQLDPALKTVIVKKQWDKLDGMPVFCLRDLLNLITELEKTPVKERFPEKKYRALKTVIVKKQWDKLDGMPVFCLRDLLNLITELEKTPVKERFPEKKYRLRWFDDELGETFLGFSNGLIKNYWSTFNAPTSNTIFTESELEQLKKDNPRLAPAIDAMKEPAEDKDE